MGRANKMIAAIKASARRSSAMIDPKSIEAAKRAKTPDTNKTVAYSLKRRNSSEEGRFAFAIQTPMMVTANSPPLYCNAFVNAKKNVNNA